MMKMSNYIGTYVVSALSLEVPGTLILISRDSRPNNLLFVLNPGSELSKGCDWTQGCRPCVCYREGAILFVGICSRFPGHCRGWLALQGHGG